LSDTLSGRGRLFLLSGEPGVGKTRLADEFSTIAASRGAFANWGRCWEGAGAPPYWPLIQIVRGCAAKPHFGRHIEGLGANVSFLASIVPEISQAFGLPLQKPGSTTRDPEEARFKLFDSVTTLLRGFSLDDPLMLVIDDLHDADQSSLKMLRFVAGGLRESRIFVLGTYRDAEVRSSPDLQRLIGDLSREALTIPLGGLGKRELAELVASRTGRPADEGFVETLYQATDGNPLFADGVVRMLIAEGEFEQGKTIRTDRFKIPTGVRESIHRSLASLPPAARPILEVGAAIGNEFDVGLLQASCGNNGEDLRLLLDQGSRVGVLSSAAESRGSRRFAHALIREAIYQEIDSSARRRLHATIGAAIESRYGSELKPHLAALAHHFLEAENPEKAIDYLIRAGDAALAVYAFDGAISHWENTVALLQEHGDDLNRKADLLAKLGLTLYQVESYNNKGIVYLEQALSIYERVGDEARADQLHQQLGMILVLPGPLRDVSRALNHLRRAEPRLSKGPDTAALAFLYNALGVAAERQFRMREALEFRQRATEVAERLGDNNAWCPLAAHFGTNLVETGRVSEAQALISKVRPRVPSVTDGLCAHAAFHGAGGFYSSMWDPRSAREWYQQGLASPVLARSQRKDMSNFLGGMALWLGDLALSRQLRGEEGFPFMLAFFEGDWERDRDLLESALEWAPKTFVGFEIFMRRSLAYVLRALGEHSRACVVLESFVHNFAPGEPICRIEMWARPELALLYTELGRLEYAREQVARCDEITAGGENWRGLGAHAERAAAALAAAEGRHSDADARFATSAGVFNRLSLVWEEADVLHRWGRALASAGEEDRAIEKLDATTEIYRRHGAGQRWIDYVAADRSRIDAARRNVFPAAPVSDGAPAVFRREGEYWTISYRDHIFRLKNMKGLHYITHLLAHPGEQFHVHELVAVVDHATQADETFPRDSELRVANDLGDAGAILDPRAKTEYRSRRVELQGELAEAEEANDGGRAELIREELEMLEEQLATAMGLGGRDRKAADHAERTRSRVGRAIRSSLKSIRENDPSLGHHLETCIQTGYLCAYRPGPEASLAWRL
jgi:tetratricopeptide (TPR) repeat protein